MTARFIIDSRFEVSLSDGTIVGDRTAMLPRVTARGWIHSIHQIGVDSGDPYPRSVELIRSVRMSG